MPEQQPLELPKPKMIVSLVFTHNQTMELMSNRYTIKELSSILDSLSLPIEFWGCDENLEPVYVSINQPAQMLGYMLRDYESFVKSQTRARSQLAVPGPTLRR